MWGAEIQSQSLALKSFLAYITHQDYFNEVLVPRSSPTVDECNVTVNDQ